MAQSSSFNLFDLSSQGSKKKQVKPKSVASFPSFDANSSKISDKQAQDSLKQMIDLQKDLDQKINTLFKTGGFSHQQIIDYCEKSGKFSRSQMEKLASKKAELESKITGLDQETLTKTKKLKLDLKSSKERRGKTLGNRKKWIPIP